MCTDCNPLLVNLCYQAAYASTKKEEEKRVPPHSSPRPGSMPGFPGGMPAGMGGGMGGGTPGGMPGGMGGGFPGGMPGGMGGGFPGSGPGGAPGGIDMSKILSVSALNDYLELSFLVGYLDCLSLHDSLSQFFNFIYHAYCNFETESALFSYPCLHLELEQDPELMAAFSDPEVMAALQDGQISFHLYLSLFVPSVIWCCGSVFSKSPGA